MDEGTSNVLSGLCRREGCSTRSHIPLQVTRIYVFCLKVTVYNSIQRACIIGMALLSYNLSYEQKQTDVGKVTQYFTCRSNSETAKERIAPDVLRIAHVYRAICCENWCTVAGMAITTNTHPLKQSGPVILLYGGSIPHVVSEEKSTPSDML